MKGWHCFERKCISIGSFCRYSEIFEGDENLFKEKDRLAQTQALFRMFLSNESSQCYYSFCNEDIADEDCDWHCTICKRCRDWREWHCDGCNKCKNVHRLNQIVIGLFQVLMEQQCHVHDVHQMKMIETMMRGFLAFGNSDVFYSMKIVI